MSKFESEIKLESLTLLIILIFSAILGATVVAFAVSVENSAVSEQAVRNMMPPLFLLT